MQRVFISGILLLCGVLAQEQRPNIVLIMADDLGSAELGCTGSQVIKTPNIDALRNNGLLFTQAYAGAPVCAPSRCVLLTGRDSLHAQIRDNREVKNPQPKLYGGQPALAKNTPTLASVLQSKGYATGCFGKWGLGGAVPEHADGHPLRQGFDRFYGYLCQRNAHSYWPEYLDSDFERAELAGNHRSEGTQYAPDLITAEALRWLDGVKDKPFFLYFPSIIPHLALQAPPADVAAIPEIAGDAPYDGKKGYAACARPRATYTAMVQKLDAHVGLLVEKVRALGMLDRTVFIVLSDNGATWDLGGYDPKHFNGNGALRGHKSQVYEGGLRIPMVVSWPGHTQPMSSCSLPVAHQDLLPTLCDLAGVTTPANHEGLSLAAWFRGATGPETRSPLVWEFPEGKGSQAVRMGSWKGVRRGGKTNAKATLELYDLAKDPAESDDVAAVHADIVAHMMQLLQQRTAADVPGWNFAEPEK